MRTQRMTGITAAVIICIKNTSELRKAIEAFGKNQQKKKNILGQTRHEEEGIEVP